eukprot:7513021-Ditylum_brightwellii.AAC.1
MGVTNDRAPNNIKIINLRRLLRCMKENNYNDDSAIVFAQHHELHRAELAERMLRDIDAEGITVDGSLRGEVMDLCRRVRGRGVEKDLIDEIFLRQEEESDEEEYEEKSYEEASSEGKGHDDKEAERRPEAADASYSNESVVEEDLEEEQKALLEEEIAQMAAQLK